MYHLSDSDSVDSDEGIRYKTESIRNKSRKREVSDTDRNKSGHRSSSSHLHNKSRYNSRSRRYSSSDSDNSRRKRHSDRKRRENSPGRNSSENRHKSEKRKKEDARKKERIEDKKEVSRHSLSSKIDKKSDQKMILSGPELPGDLHTKVEKIKTTENSIDQKTNYLGPELPPNLKKKTTENESNINEPHVIGPTLPQSIINKSEETKEVLGPVLPPHLKNTERPVQSHVTSTLPTEDECETSDKCIGPSLPPHLRQKLAEESEIADTKNEENNDQEEETHGPVPVGSSFSQAHLDLEERALQIKINQLGPSEKQEPAREEWMVELPAAKASNLGLGPRQFRAKAGPDLSDRSSWTDTPQAKAKKKQGKEEPKVDLQREAELAEIRKRDKEQEVVAKKSKRNKESLVDIHVKKMKDKKDPTASNERRPFSREVDLQVNRFDEAQKKAVLKKAQLLDTRFSSGESKFL